MAVWNNQSGNVLLQPTLGPVTLISNHFATGAGGAASKGGGVFLGKGTLVLDQATITGNGAATGGGLYLVSGTSWNGDPYGYIWNNFPDNIFEEL